jgi:hypothetical protein
MTTESHARDALAEMELVAADAAQLCSVAALGGLIDYEDLWKLMQKILISRYHTSRTVLSA